MNVTSYVFLHDLKKQTQRAGETPAEMRQDGEYRRENIETADNTRA